MEKLLLLLVNILAIGIIYCVWFIYSREKKFKAGEDAYSIFIKQIFAACEESGFTDFRIALDKQHFLVIKKSKSTLLRITIFYKKNDIDHNFLLNFVCKEGFNIKYELFHIDGYLIKEFSENNISMSMILFGIKAQKDGQSKASKSYKENKQAK